MTESLEFFQIGLMNSKKKTKRKQKIKELKETINTLTEKNKSLTSDVDELEQYSYRNCLLLHGVQENENENTDYIVLKTMSEESRKMIWTEHTELIAQTGKILNHKLLFSISSAMPSEIRK